MEKEMAVLTNLLLKGDHINAWKLIAKCHDESLDPLILFEKLFTPAMAHIGLLWEEDQITVADEHLATSTCDHVLSRYQQFLLKDREKSVSDYKKGMLLCLEDELHYLGLKMVSILFELHGYKTRLFGANLPLEYALKTAADWHPEVIGLSFSLRKHADRLTQYIQELEKLDYSPEVIVGGRLVSSIDYKECCSEKTRIFHTLTDLNKWLKMKDEKADFHV